MTQLVLAGSEAYRELLSKGWRPLRWVLMAHRRVVIMVEEKTGRK